MKLISNFTFRTMNLSQRMFCQVALNKPSGLQVLPKGLFQQRTVLAQLQLKDWKMASSCQSKRKDVQSHPVPVHRLGRGTSGLFLFYNSVLTCHVGPRLYKETARPGWPQSHWGSGRGHHAGRRASWRYGRDHQACRSGRNGKWLEENNSRSKS